MCARAALIALADRLGPDELRLIADELQARAADLADIGPGLAAEDREAADELLRLARELEL